MAASESVHRHGTHFYNVLLKGHINVPSIHREVTAPSHRGRCPKHASLIVGQNDV